MHRAVLVLGGMALGLLVACGKKKGPDPAAENEEPAAPVFIDIDMGAEEDELDDMIGSELMQATAECGNLKKMEPAAMMGKLSDGEIRCLDVKLREAERQTFKDKLSRVLMADAWPRATSIGGRSSPAAT